MSSRFEAYARRAKGPLSFTAMSGRYSIQHEGERRAVLDIAKKLVLEPTDRLLDVGCGVGTLTIPLSFLVRETVALDHPDVVSVLQQRLPEENLRVVGGSFLEEQLVEQFEKALCYGVLQALPDRETVVAFLERLLTVVTPGGRLLVGDLPNEDRKSRFQRSEEGRRFAKRWAEVMKDETTQAELAWVEENIPKTETASFDDAFCLELLHLCRRAGADAWLLPQPPDLPFGLTREDLVVQFPR